MPLVAAILDLGLEGNGIGSREITVKLIFERDEFEEEQRSNDKEIEAYITEPPINNMFPCSLREHNAQAPKRAPVPVASTRVFPKGKGNVRCWDRNIPLCNHRDIPRAPLRRV